MAKLEIIILPGLLLVGSVAVLISLPEEKSHNCERVILGLPGEEGVEVGCNKESKIVIVPTREEVIEEFFTKFKSKNN